MPSCLSRPPIPLGSVATTLKWIAETMQLKKNFPIVPGYFFGKIRASASSEHRLTDNSSAIWDEDRGSSQDQWMGGNCLGSWHSEKMNLDLWADQSLASLPSWLYSLLHGAQGSAMIPQHSLASHMKKQSNSSAM